jgi:hypothetical protein
MVERTFTTGSSRKHAMPIQLFDLLRIYEPNLDESTCKVHLAGHDGRYEPLNLFFDGRFDAWHRVHNKKFFNEPHAVTLIQMEDKRRWLFAGVFETGEPSWEYSPMFEEEKWVYPMERMEAFQPLVGRAIIRYHRTGRNAYRFAESFADELVLDEFLRERLSIGEFPGYHKVQITYGELQAIVRKQVPSWRAALKNVAGVYVISDSLTGKLYVGSATGIEGIWRRWSSYADNGHGGNKELRALLRDKGSDYAEHFTYGILEIADTHASRDDVLARESHWKRLLQSREFGWNEN